MLYSSLKGRVGSIRQSVSSSSLVKRPYAIGLSFSYTIPDEKHQKHFFAASFRNCNISSKHAQQCWTAIRHPSTPNPAMATNRTCDCTSKKAYKLGSRKRVLFNVFTLIHYDCAYDFTMLCVYICVFFPDFVSIVKLTTVISICSRLCYLGPCVPSSARCQ